MAKETIKLSLEKGTNDLILTDSQGNSGKNITTVVHFGDTVVWEIAEGAKITKITDIYRKEGSVNLFATLPAPLEGNQKWLGVIGVKKGLEAYGVKYTVEGEETEFDVDPFVKVNGGG